MATTRSPRAKMAAVPPVLRTAARLLTELEPGQSAVINGLTWPSYRWIDTKRDAVRPKLKLAYHQGSLELMVVSFFHDDISRRLQIVVRHACAALAIPLRSPGGATLLSEDVDSGLEPDESFYIQSVAAVRGVRDLDLSIHPPPDLVIEVDHSRSSLGKQPIYAALGVPELWRFADGEVTFLVRNRRGVYRPQAASRALPVVNSADVSRLVLTESDDDTAVLEAVMAWADALKPATK